jgi:hypothetical protein
VAGTINQVQAVVGVLVHDDGHPGTNMKMAGIGKALMKGKESAG